MSTEHQQYSTENQADVIREYAERHGFEIAGTFEDSGKSGLQLRGRDSLKNLLDVVEAGKADFDTILVYDVSRWKRFQDADESAYYEYRCKKAGINVEYCAEQFANDGSPTATTIKSVKRAMAGEYSRELSAKVFKGQCRLIQLGYRQGGLAGFGLRGPKQHAGHLLEPAKTTGCIVPETSGTPRKYSLQVFGINAACNLFMFSSCTKTSAASNSRARSFAR